MLAKKLSLSATNIKKQTEKTETVFYLPSGHGHKIAGIIIYLIVIVVKNLQLLFLLDECICGPTMRPPISS